MGTSLDAYELNPYMQRQGQYVNTDIGIRRLDWNMDTLESVMNSLFTASSIV